MRIYDRKTGIPTSLQQIPESKRNQFCNQLFSVKKMLADLNVAISAIEREKMPFDRLAQSSLSRADSQYLPCLAAQNVDEM